MAAVILSRRAQVIWDPSVRKLFRLDPYGFMAEFVSKTSNYVATFYHAGDYVNTFMPQWNRYLSEMDKIQEAPAQVAVSVNIFAEIDQLLYVPALMAMEYNIYYLWLKKHFPNYVS